MTQLEQTIIRFILAINAGMTGVVGAVELMDNVNQTVMIVVLLVAAFLSSVAGFFTTNTAHSAVRSMTNGSGNP